MKRLLVSMILTGFAVFLWFSLNPGPGGTALAFSDTDKHWARQEIQEWVSGGRIKGYPDQTFRPDRRLTRAEAAALINRALGIPEGHEAETAAFPDMVKGRWDWGPLTAAVASGYMHGYADGTMGADRPVSRQEMAVMLTRLVRYDKDEAGMPPSFTDPLPGWSREAVGAAAAAGWMQGYPDGSFKAERPLTRAEAVVILGRFMQAEGKANDEGEVRYARSGTYGPEAGRRVIEGNVTVAADAITLRNVTVAGDLTLTEGVGDGDVLLRGVVVKGKLSVQGGGENTIRLQDTEIRELDVHKKVGTPVRLAAEGSTIVEETLLHTSAVLEDEELREGSGFRRVGIAEEMKADGLIRLRGDFAALTVRSGEVRIQLERGAIGRLDLPEGSRNRDIWLAEGARVEEAIIAGPAVFRGQGVIAYAEIRTSGVRFERNPDRVSCPSGISHALCGTHAGIPTSTSSDSYGGGTSGGGEQPAASVTALVYEPRQVVLSAPGGRLQLKLEAKWSDGRSTDATLAAEWSTDDPAIAAVSKSGLVTEAGEGHTFISAAYMGHSVRIPVDVVYRSTPPESTVTELVYRPESVRLTSLGERVQLELSAKWSDGSVEDIAGKAHWRSLDPHVAAVSDSGLIEAAGEGVARIEAEYEGIAVNIPVHVVLSDTVLDAATVMASISSADPLVGSDNALVLTVKRSDGSVDTGFNGKKKAFLSLSGPTNGSIYGYGVWNKEQMTERIHETEITFVDGVSNTNLVLFKADPHTITVKVEDVKVPEASVMVRPTPEQAARVVVSELYASGTAKSGKMFLNLVVDLLDPYDNIASHTNKKVRVSVKNTGESSPDLIGTQEVLSIHGQAVFSDLYGRGTGRFILNITAEGLPAYETYPITIQAPFQGKGTDTDPYLVDSAQLLDEVRYYPEASFRQTRDIDLSVYSAEEGWAPIGKGLLYETLTYDSFTGSYDGGGFAIHHLTIQTQRGWIGLFGHTRNAELKNIHLKDLRMEGTFYAGGLVGEAWESRITDSSVEGTIRGTSCFGGLSGYARETVVARSSAKVQLTAIQASSDVRLTIVGYIGGLSGGMEYGTVTDSFATGTITTDDEAYDVGVGGLFGFFAGESINYKGTLDRSYAEVDIRMKRGTRVGGLVGATYGSSLTDTYAKGRIEVDSPLSRDGVGGLIGRQENGFTRNSYAAVQLTTDPTENTGGLVGLSLGYSDYTASFYDSGVSGRSDTGKGIPLNTANMRKPANYKGWDFPGTWSMTEGCGYPYLSWQKEVSASDCFQVKLLEEGTKTHGKIFQLLITGAKDAAGLPLNGAHQVEVFLSSIPYTPILSSQAEPFEEGERKVSLAVHESGKVSLVVKILHVDGYRTLDVELGPHPFDGGKGTKSDPFLISTAEQLDMVRDFTRSHFKMTADIDLDAPPYATGAGWRPIGTRAQPVYGSLDGDGHTIHGLTIRNTNQAPAGLFGILQGAEIRNLHLTGVDITSSAPEVGGLAGILYYGHIENVSVQGAIASAAQSVGGLSGVMYGSAKNVAIDAEVSGSYWVGGVSGVLKAARRIENASVKGSVTATSGLAGGIAGSAETNSVILNSYALAKVTAPNKVGGIVGGSLGTIQKCYAAGWIQGNSKTGGISGSEGLITDSYYDSESTRVIGGGGEPKTTEEMKRQATFANWDFIQVWEIKEGVDYPTLRRPHP
ncbi:S-layer homology domain-containing protein [Paenibacillus sp. alder61]|uniref:SLH domain-containing protein n=1 Tax=Paenibacillus faecis TaxID=862114 RepID=A0A5D0CSF3_9BACL|nr:MULTISPECIES: S-layer homology domain-containing protein [Paenibacillus]MCA1293628.1 S-layer homology domain-containing protein [Paenibacillus sp. alder61]TYA12742.1 hypothetical protein FRY98_08500 [Paenibacillus faecis]